MNLTGILKSLLLVASSVLIWATPITLTQAVGYSIALAGMFYYALPPDSPPPHRLLLAKAAGLLGGGRGVQRPWARGGGGEGHDDGAPGGRGGYDHEDSFLLDERGRDEEGVGAPAHTGRPRRRSELNINVEKLASHED